MRSMSRSSFALSAIAGAVAGTAGAARAASPMLDVINHRPYDWGTPLGELSGNLFTPNRAFFIRSHMGPPRAAIKAAEYRLSVNGLVSTPLSLSLDDLKAMPRAEVPAVLQCAGNGRAFYGVAYPDVSHPAGAQWWNGAVGNARWAGVRVRDVLAKAGVDPKAKFATNFGLDDPLLPTTPKFVRGIELDKLMDEDTIFAYEMNGEPIPYYHGFPVRLVVPGWAGDHFVKWFTNMTLAETITDKFWTAVGYRYPNTIGEPGKGMKPTDMHPVTVLNVKSVVTTPLAGSTPRVDSATFVRGFAWSGNGAHATRVEVSTDGGTSWRDALLDPSPGKYSWRAFSYRWVPSAAGAARIMARATDNLGAVQPVSSPWNPSGYLWNGIQSVDVEVVNA